MGILESVLKLINQICMEKNKPKTVYHKTSILMDNKVFELWLDCNDDFAKSLCQKHEPKTSEELKKLINTELKREAAILE